MRNRELDGLRGLAAMAVAIGHCITATFGIEVWQKSVADFASMSWQQIAGRLGHVLFPADAAVVVFFVLSGYVLWGSLVRRGSGDLTEFLPYAVSRAYRLLPVAIASAMALGFLIPTASIDLVKNALLLSYNINGPIWTLQVEVIGSLLIFAMFATVVRTTPFLLTIFTAGLAIAAIYNQHSLILFLSTFAMGASLHYLPVRWFESRWLMAAYLPLIFADLLIGHGLIARFVALPPPSYLSDPSQSADRSFSLRDQCIFLARSVTRSICSISLARHWHIMSSILPGACPKTSLPPSCPTQSFRSPSRCPLPIWHTSLWRSLACTPAPSWLLN